MNQKQPSFQEKIRSLTIQVLLQVHGFDSINSQEELRQEILSKGKTLKNKVLGHKDFQEFQAGKSQTDKAIDAGTVAQLFTDNKSFTHELWQILDGVRTH